MDNPFTYPDKRPVERIGFAESGHNWEVVNDGKGGAMAQNREHVVTDLDLSSLDTDEKLAALREKLMGGQISPDNPAPDVTGPPMSEGMKQARDEMKEIRSHLDQTVVNFQSTMDRLRAEAEQLNAEARIKEIAADDIMRFLNNNLK